MLLPGEDPVVLLRATGAPAVPLVWLPSPAAPLVALSVRALLGLAVALLSLPLTVLLAGLVLLLPPVAEPCAFASACCICFCCLCSCSRRRARTSCCCTCMQHAARKYL